MAKDGIDKELELYRNLLQPPSEFSKGFGWTTVAGIIFCGLVMLPGSIYLGLMSGGNLGTAASWVTVILFNEIARRSLKKLSKQNLVILLHAAQVIMIANILFPGGPCAQLVFRAYLAGSQAFRDAGMTDFLPSWFVPPPDSPAVTQRNLFHPDWLIPIALLLFIVINGLIKRYTLGYFFFRLTSDVEHLPFPKAPIAAQGAMALSEADETAGGGDDPAKAFFDKNARIGGPAKSSRWRLFSLGAVLGVAFGFIQVGVPAITGVVLSKRVFLIPQPFIDTTTLTETFLPATPTGLALDLGILLVGMVLPRWAVLGTFTAIIATLILNPVLHQLGVLTAWQPGMDTVNTTFANEVDFWMSFGIGASLGLLGVSIFQSIRQVRRRMGEIRAARRQQAESRREDLWSPPVEGRGDYPMWIALGGYVATSVTTILITYLLLRQSPLMTPAAMTSVMSFLLIFSFVYNPLISYLNARLLGIAGQNVDIPYVKETAFVLSGAKGLGIWCAPVTVENFGHQAQAFRVTELTGTNFRSMIKTDFIAIPTLFLLSLVFWAFIWASSEIPSVAYPYAQTFWEIQSKRMALMWSSTHVVPGQPPVDFWQTPLGQAIHPNIIGGGAASTVVLFTSMSLLGLPVMFVYGVIRGLGQFPHMLALEFAGAMIGRFYFQKKYGDSEFLRMIPTVVAGYFTGVGLIGMATIAIELIARAVSASPF
jgi:hypothetical protein